MPPRIRIRLNGLKSVYKSQGGGAYLVSLQNISKNHLLSPTPCLLPTRRDFSHISPLQKKNKHQQPHGSSKHEAAVETEARSPPEEQDSNENDPHNFSKLEDGITKSLEKLQRDLSKLRTGGRFNPEVLESLRVEVDKSTHETVRLGDLAQVIPKGGRSLALLVGEKEHLKPIISAIQGSKDLNLQPTPDPQNANQLNVPIPPPTKESRDLAINAAQKAGDMATTGVRNARAHMQKHLRALELKRIVRPDDLRRAHKDMEKVVEKGIADVKKAVDTARKTMEQ